MESQPLASANQADAETQAQCMATDGVNAKASTADCTVATGDREGFQTGPEPSSPGVAHKVAEIQHTAADDSRQHTAADDSTQLQDSPVQHNEQEEGLWVAGAASPDKGLVSEAVYVEDVGEVADSQDGSLAAVPPNDEEAEVCDSLQIVLGTCLCLHLFYCYT